MYWAKLVWEGVGQLWIFLFLCLYIVCVDRFHLCKNSYLSICSGPKNLQIDEGLSVLQKKLSVNTDRKMVILFVYLSINQTKTLFFEWIDRLKKLRNMCAQKPLQMKEKTAHTIFCLSVLLLPVKQNHSLSALLDWYHMT